MDDFSCYRDALPEKTLPKSPGESSLFPWDYSLYRQKQNFASPYYIRVSYVSVLPSAGLLVESGGADLFSTYLKPTSTLTDVNGRPSTADLEPLTLGAHVGTR